MRTLTRDNRVFLQIMVDDFLSVHGPKGDARTWWNGEMNLSGDILRKEFGAALPEAKEWFLRVVGQRVGRRPRAVAS